MTALFDLLLSMWEGLLSFAKEAFLWVWDFILGVLDPLIQPISDGAAAFGVAFTQLLGVGLSAFTPAIQVANHGLAAAGAPSLSVIMGYLATIIAGLVTFLVARWVIRFIPTIGGG